ncbi:transmembrane protein 69-like [Entelurus aequoreus]|uniref:transmembrane protein 69-like n=1 Tax=Entelurus aequoreus TaxID=161455 RepID=UPI002B1D67F8|nr:transmembrane protein 69-like [Entelurus aequoreus]
MFSAILRSTITAQKVWHLARPSPKCRTLLLTRATNPGRSDPPHINWVCSSRWPTLRTGVIQKTHAATFTARNQYFHSSVVRLKKREEPEPPPRELDLLRYDMKDFWKSPKPALWLGFAGLIPFVAPTLFMGVVEICYTELAYAQVAYGASIISFLGGSRWGFALPESSPAKPDWINLGNSVACPLLAWAAMLMADNVVSAATMVIIALGISLHYDLSLLPTYPSWFKALRTVLTIVASASLVGTIVGINVYPTKKLFSE